MKITKIKKIAASVAICLLCGATGVFSVLAVTRTPLTVKGQQTYADGFVTVDSEGLDDEFEFGITHIDEDFFSPYSHTPTDTGDKIGYDNPAAEILLPGASRSGSITFKNNSEDANIGLLFRAESTPYEGTEPDEPHYNEIPYEMYKAKNYSEYDAPTLKKASDLLVGNYLELEIKDPDGKTVYRGKVNGENGDVKKEDERDPDFDEPGATFNMSSSPINIGLLNPGESAKYTFTLKVPKSLESFPREDSPEEDAGLIHGYDNTVAMIDWHFGVVIVAAPTAPTTTTTTTTSPTTTTTTTKPSPPSPGTGEAPNMYLFAAIACGVSALVIFYVTFCGGKRKKREEE